MTNQPNPTPPPFRPVPAVPITVLPAPKGLRIVRTPAGVAWGATFSEAIAAATKDKP